METKTNNKSPEQILFDNNLECVMLLGQHGELISKVQRGELITDKEFAIIIAIQKKLCDNPHAFGTKFKTDLMDFLERAKSQSYLAKQKQEIAKTLGIDTSNWEKIELGLEDKIVLPSQIILFKDTKTQEIIFFNETKTKNKIYLTADNYRFEATNPSATNKEKNTKRCIIEKEGKTYFVHWNKRYDLDPILVELDTTKNGYKILPIGTRFDRMDSERVDDHIVYTGNGFFEMQLKEFGKFNRELVLFFEIEGEKNFFILTKQGEEFLVTNITKDDIGVYFEDLFSISNAKLIDSEGAFMIETYIGKRGKNIKKLRRLRCKIPAPHTIKDFFYNKPNREESIADMERLFPELKS